MNKLLKGMYKNPLIEGADPFVLVHEGRYYLYSTNSDDGFKVFVSDDMASWTDMGYCLKKGDVIGERWFWAPEIVEMNWQIDERSFWIPIIMHVRKGMRMSGLLMEPQYSEAHTKNFAQ